MKKLSFILVFCFFAVVVSADVVGLWNFDGDLTADIGLDMEYYEPDAGDPAATNWHTPGDPDNRCTFGKCLDLGAPKIAGSNEDILFVGPLQRGTTEGMGLKLFPNIATPTDGGSRVNDYTLIMDIAVHWVGDYGYASIMQTNPISGQEDQSPVEGEVIANNDGDWYYRDYDYNIWSEDAGVMGEYGCYLAGGYAPGDLVLDEWHRVGLLYDVVLDGGTTPSGRMQVYIDGVKAQPDPYYTWYQGRIGEYYYGEFDKYGDPFLDGRLSLPTSGDTYPYVLMFMENDSSSGTGRYTGMYYVNSMILLDEVLDPWQMAAGGAPQAGGIDPGDVPVELLEFTAE